MCSLRGTTSSLVHQPTTFTDLSLGHASATVLEKWIQLACILPELRGPPNSKECGSRSVNLCTTVSTGKLLVATHMWCDSPCAHTSSTKCHGAGKRNTVDWAFLSKFQRCSAFPPPQHPFGVTVGIPEPRGSASWLVLRRHPASPAQCGGRGQHDAGSKQVKAA